MYNVDGLVRGLLSIDQCFVVLFPFKFSHELFSFFNKTIKFEFDILWEPI